MTADPIIKFATQEILQVHALCDRAMIPRVIDGELQSMSQRVCIMEYVCAALTKQLGMKPTSTEH